jgi:predicted RecB family endonuclease
VITTLKHDKYLEDLCESIKDDYDGLWKNVTLFSPKTKRKVAEIDILAVRDNKYYVYEVKCSYRISKARRQLRKIKRLLPNVRELFFFCGEGNVIERIA